MELLRTFAADAEIAATDAWYLANQSNLLQSVSTRQSGGFSCSSKSTNEQMMEWCQDHCFPKHYRCMGFTVADEVPCQEACKCSFFGHQDMDLLFVVGGSLSLVACLIVMGLGLSGVKSRRAPRAPTQGACLFWSNFCNCFYAVYCLLYGVVDAMEPMKEMPADMCFKAWRGPFGQAECQGQGYGLGCFLNCCCITLPWLEFFGYSSLFWNILWLLDLARYVRQPWAPEKFLGIRLITFYHFLTWVSAVLVAASWDHSRLDPRQCRTSRVSMIPCLMRQDNIKQSLPWIHIAGLLCAVFALASLAQSYVTSRVFLRPTANGRQYPVQWYLRMQLFHIVCLIVCWGLILVDTVRPCADDITSIVTGFGCTGLGFFLSLDKLVTATRKHRRRQSQASTASTETSVAAGAPELHCRGPVEVQATQEVPVDSFEDSYYRVDLDPLLEYIVQYLQEEQMRLVDLKEVLRLEDHQIRHHLSASAKLDDHPNMQAAWQVAPRNSAGQMLFTAVAPRTFTFLKWCWGVDCMRVIEELQQADTATLRNAAGSGCSILTASDGRSFALKTVSDREVRRLVETLTAYRMHMTSHPQSFICRIYGCFSWQNGFGSRLHVLLMDHVAGSPGLPSALAHGSFSCAGIGVSCSPEQAGLQAVPPPCGGFGGASPLRLFDMKSEFQDGHFLRVFPSGLRVPAGHRDAMCDVHLAADYDFLKTQGMVDYSILLSIWNASEAMINGGVACESHDAPGGRRQQLVVRLAIIDFLVPYDASKRTESALKRSYKGRARVTILDPETYAERQRSFVFSRVFPSSTSSPGLPRVATWA